ncbi:accessory factor UbiK family protein [Vreelandella populi]|uniref:Ubiquinone biosynthesis accessory factor UbiK n=1 Tax=Vreelandella populi TaxID=2498858 RepID=A0A433LE66_9GAMM|nr:accessory factor UbiK family protein [Halomonas populi]RUR35544.1 accessory factor UbiK family protein [Halomonas populi]RUR47734.1 accessory factor UbiK family protein [Halomonas populi]RUR54403.1 accessory factor UbiK family protein [Halomonas populi]
MTPQDRISRLAQQIGDRLQNASQAPEDIQKGVQQVVRGAFDRLELVSREDFDILMDVLQRTRTRVEALERQVASLETAIENQKSAPKAPAPTSSVEAKESPAKDDTAKATVKKPKTADTATPSKRAASSSLKDDK